MLGKHYLAMADLEWGGVAKKTAAGWREKAAAKLPHSKGFGT
jgi:hypothetical protein